MKSYLQKFLLIACFMAYLTTSCTADVAQRYNNNNNNRATLLRLRAQRLESAYQTPYPSVGFRPERPFDLPTTSAGAAEVADQQNFTPNEFSQFDGNNFNFPPNNNNGNNNNNDFNNADAAQPDALYGAPVADPARLRQLQSSRFQQQQQLQAQQQQQQQLQAQQQQLLQAQQQQQQLQAQQQQLLQAQQQQQLQAQQQQQAQQFPRTRLQFTPARLTDEREERELVQDNPSDIELDVRNAAENIPTTTNVAAPAPPTIAYYPAGAFGFVKPLNAPANPVQPLNPAGAYVQYQSNGLVSPLGKFIAAPAAPQLPIASTSPYYATSFAPQSLAFTAYAPYTAAAAAPIAPAQLQAW